MLMSSEEVADLLSALAGLDKAHTTISQEKFAQKVDAWSPILADVTYSHCLRAIQAHYADPNAKSMTPGLLRLQALRFAPAAPKPAPHTPEALKAAEQACRTPGCPCDHLSCYDGWLEADEERITRYGVYESHSRCGTCQNAAEARRVG